MFHLKSYPRTKYSVTALWTFVIYKRLICGILSLWITEFLFCYCLRNSPPFVLFLSQINLIYILATYLIVVHFNAVLLHLCLSSGFCLQFYKPKVNGRNIQITNDMHFGGLWCILFTLFSTTCFGRYCGHLQGEIIAIIVQYYNNFTLEMVARAAETCCWEKCEWNTS